MYYLFHDNNFETQLTSNNIPGRYTSKPDAHLSEPGVRCTEPSLCPAEPSAQRSVVSNGGRGASQTRL